MCFANAVLQLLAYCVPFSRLFEAVGKALPPPEEGKRARDAAEGATPLDIANAMQRQITRRDSQVGYSYRGGKERDAGDEEDEGGLGAVFDGPSHVAVPSSVSRMSHRGMSRERNRRLSRMSLDEFVERRARRRSRGESDR